MSIQNLYKPLYPVKELPKKQPFSFHLHRFFSFIVLMVLYSLVLFQRFCPSIVHENLAEAYGVEKSKLSIFSSMYFYTYGIMQLFAGLLADVFEPAFIIGGSQIIASIGAVLCGASKSLLVGSIGRCLVGLGCGPTYVPIIRYLLNWFEPKNFAVMIGVVLATGGIGSILSQRPLSSMVTLIGWRATFYGIGGIGFLFSIICFFFVRGDPTSRGYLPVNGNIKPPSKTLSIGEKICLLFHNLKSIASCWCFWVVAVYSVCTNGPYYSVSGLWAASYFEDVFGYSRTVASDITLGLPVGIIVGSLLIPLLSNLIKTRKWVIAAASLFATVCCALFTFIYQWLGSVSAFAILLLYAACSNSMLNVSFPLVSGYYAPQMGSTAVGCSNFLSFMASAAFQTLTSLAIQHYGTTHAVGGGGDADAEALSADGYKYGLWLFSLISTAVGGVVICFVKDSVFEKAKAKLEKEGDKGTQLRDEEREGQEKQGEEKSDDKKEEEGEKGEVERRESEREENGEGEHEKERENPKGEEGKKVDEGV